MAAKEREEEYINQNWHACQFVPDFGSVIQSKKSFGSGVDTT